MDNVDKKRKQQLINKRIVNSSVMIIGLVLLVFFSSFMQKRYSELRYQKSSKNALESIVKTMDENTEMVNQLIERYHRNNQAIVEDFVTLFHTGRYRLLYDSSIEKRCEIMKILSDSIDNKGYLFVVDNDSNVVLSPFNEYIGTNMLNDNVFSKEDFEDLKIRDAKSEISYVTGTINNSKQKGYFYGGKLSDEYYLIYGISSEELDKQYSALRKLGPILSNVVIGETGFVFAIDTNDGVFTYFDNGETELTGKKASEHGVSDELFNNYSGVQVIDDVEYNVLSRKHSTKLYGDTTLVVAACSSNEVYASDPITNTVTTVVFLVAAAICLFYAFTLQTDPEQLAYYDENLLTVSEARNSNLKDAENKKSFKNIKVFKYRNEQIYFKAGIAASLTPVIIIALLVIFAVSYNAQTMVELSKGLAESNGAVKQIENVFENSENSSELLMEYYQNQYLSKIKILSYMIEEEPGLVFNDNNKTAQSVNSLNKYKNSSYETVYNSDGSELTSISRSSVLQDLADLNGFDYLFIFDDHGRTIATNTDMWYFVLSDDETSQSHQFTKLLSGEINELIQEPKMDDSGSQKQYVGVPLYYYTYLGDGAYNGKFASEEDYFRYINNEDIVIDSTNYSVIAHTGIMQGAISDKTIASIMDSTKPETLLSNIKVDTNGFVIMFDNTADHNCLWSPYESSIGKTARELGISENAFSGIHKGLNVINGVEYFQNYLFKNGYWIATSIPSNDLFNGRLSISLITLATSSIFFLFMFIACIFTSDTEEKDLMNLVENRIIANEDNGMVKIVMNNGREKYVRTAASRFTSSTYKWVNMLPFQKLDVVFRCVLMLFVLIILVCIAVPERIFGADSLMCYIIHGDWEHSFNYFAYVAFAGTLIIVFAVTSVLEWLIKIIITNMGTRIETIGRLALSVLKYGSVLFTIFYGLSLLGVSTASLVTSASIMSIVIGLGSQSLISDILAGIFIVFEGSFRVGDIVSVDNFSGMVVDIGLRTTKIEDNLGNIKIFNNSSIKSILNMTKKASVIKINLNISYKEDLDKVEKLLIDSCDELDRKIPKLLNKPNYYGVSELGKEYITLTVIGNCIEQDRNEITMELTRELYLILKNNNISCQYNK